MAEKQQGSGDRVALVGYHDEKVEVNYSVPNGQHREDRALPKCSDKPGAGFVEAFEALSPFALEIARLKNAKGWGTAKVTKLHVSYDKHGRRGFILTVYQPLEHGGIVFNTPIRLEKLEPTEIGAGFASDEFKTAVLAVCSEALAYVRGQREQGELFEGEPGASGSEEVQNDIGAARQRRAAAKRTKAPARKRNRTKPKK